MQEAHTPTPEAGDALIYIHLHLMYSNTEAEAEVNSADSKTPPARSVDVIPQAGMNPGVPAGDQAPLQSGSRGESWCIGRGTFGLIPGFSPSALLFHPSFPTVRTRSGAC